MSKLKAVAVILAVIAFFGYCMWLSPFLFGNRIRSEMLKDSILKYDSGANIYIASKDDNSKVYFGKSGSYKFYGTGALTYMASPKSQESEFRSGFNLLIEGGNLELKTGQADILTGSVSPNGQFLALLKIDGKLSIYNISTGKTTYESTEAFIFGNPLKQNSSSYPYFYWTDQGLIVQQIDVVSVTNNEIPKLFPWQKDNQIIWGKSSSSLFDFLNKNIRIELISIEPSTGNINKITANNSNDKILRAIGFIDADNLLVYYTSGNQEKKQAIMSLKTSIISELPDLPTDIICISNDKLFFVKDNVLVSSTITAKSSSAPASINLPELDDEKLAPDKIANLRVTSKGYLYFRHIKTAKTYLLDPDTGVYVEIPKERYPY